MSPLIISLDERLSNPGDTLPVAGHLDQDGYALGDHEFSLPDGMDYDVVLTNAGEGVLVTGLLKAHVVGACDRCLEEAAFDVASEVDEYYLFEELVGDDHTIDLAGALVSALVMETPFVVLCRPDCRGLCPVCGANLNEGDCGHGAAREAAREEDRLMASPFVALSGLDLGEGGSADEVPGE